MYFCILCSPCNTRVNASTAKYPPPGRRARGASAALPASLLGPHRANFTTPTTSPPSLCSYHVCCCNAAPLTSAHLTLFRWISRSYCHPRTRPALLAGPACHGTFACLVRSRPVLCRGTNGRVMGSSAGCGSLLTACPDGHRVQVRPQRHWPDFVPSGQELFNHTCSLARHPRRLSSKIAFLALHTSAASGHRCDRLNTPCRCQSPDHPPSLLSWEPTSQLR